MRTAADRLFERLMQMADGVPHKVTRVHDELTLEPLGDTVEAALTADREAALRDVFAAAALGALIGKEKDYEGCDLAEVAYSYADDMMEARKA